MIFAILAYSITTGLSAFAWDWVSFALLRFLVGSPSALNGQPAPPDCGSVATMRAADAGLMQCGLGIGFFLASFTWLFVGYGPHAWRIMFFIRSFRRCLRSGCAPAFRVAKVGAQQQRKSIGREKEWRRNGEEDRAFTLYFRGSFADPNPQAPSSYSDVADDDGGMVGHLDLVPPFVAAAAGKAGLPSQTWASYAGMSYNSGPSAAISAWLLG
jgi:hypothetical protein